MSNRNTSGTIINNAPSLITEGGPDLSAIKVINNRMRNRIDENVPFKKYGSPEQDNIEYLDICCSLSTEYAQALGVVRDTPQNAGWGRILVVPNPAGFPAEVSDVKFVMDEHDEHDSSRRNRILADHLIRQFVFQGIAHMNYRVAGAGKSSDHQGINLQHFGPVTLTLPVAKYIRPFSLLALDIQSVPSGTNMILASTQDYKKVRFTVKEHNIEDAIDAMRTCTRAFLNLYKNSKSSAFGFMEVMQHNDAGTHIYQVDASRGHQFITGLLGLSVKLLTIIGAATTDSTEQQTAKDAVTLILTFLDLQKSENKKRAGIEEVFSKLLKEHQEDYSSSDFEELDNMTRNSFGNVVYSVASIVDEMRSKIIGQAFNTDPISTDSIGTALGLQAMDVIIRKE